MKCCFVWVKALCNFFFHSSIFFPASVSDWNLHTISLCQLKLRFVGEHNIGFCSHGSVCKRITRRRLSLIKGGGDQKQTLRGNEKFTTETGDSALLLQHTFVCLWIHTLFPGETAAQMYTDRQRGEVSVLAGTTCENKIHRLMVMIVSLSSSLFSPPLTPIVIQSYLIGALFWWCCSSKWLLHEVNEERGCSTSCLNVTPAATQHFRLLDLEHTHIPPSLKTHLDHRMLSSSE